MQACTPRPRVTLYTIHQNLTHRIAKKDEARLVKIFKRDSRTLWRILGVIGLVLPLLPGVPPGIVWVVAGFKLGVAVVYAFCLRGEIAV